VRIIAVVGIAVGIAALGGAAHDASGRSFEYRQLHAPAVPLHAGTSTGLVDHAFCRVIGNNKVQGAAVALLSPASSTTETRTKAIRIFLEVWAGDRGERLPATAGHRMEPLSERCVQHYEQPLYCGSARL
jgi:hypothetical protein